MKMNTVKRKIYETLGIADMLFGEGRSAPISLAQARRILSIKHISDLNDSDYELIEKNMDAAIAYYEHLKEVNGLNKENDISSLGNVIELFPPKKLINPSVPAALAASSSDKDDNADEPIRNSVPTRQCDVAVMLENRTNPMTGDITVRFRIHVDDVCQNPITIAWKPTGGDQAVMECLLPTGSNDAVATRIFTKEQWSSLKSITFEFGEISSD
ncbi:hypothetical protein [Glaciecola sp. 1036]|uniref:hypothetical protein n=1 Tax=Alteromonadaceae TaxID=72275 RepID=UPI003CFFE2BF